jgi:hypothetical protein
MMCTWGIWVIWSWSFLIGSQWYFFWHFWEIRKEFYVWAFLSQCKEAYCCACGCEGSTPLCRRCAGRLKTKLLDVAKRRLDIECAQRHCYCLECKEIFTGTHPEHGDKTVPLGCYKKQLVAWVTGEETWRGIFERIETQDRAIKPYLLYKSGNPRCKVCGDIVAADQLYGVLFTFCSLSCFVRLGLVSSLLNTYHISYWVS